jgi:hypothetical protein
MSYLGNYLFTQSPDNDTDPDHVYYNATIINNRTGTPYDRSADPAVRFQETRDSPLVQDASKYNFSIVRFVLDGPNKDLPLFIPIIRTGAENPTNNVNLTIYSVSIEMVISNTTGANPVSLTSTQTVPIVWVPETLDTSVAPVPAGSTTQTGQDLSTRYYWCYTYSHWLTCVNTALASCITAIQTDFDAAWTAAGNAGSAPSLGLQNPYILFNPTTGLFTIYTPSKAFGGAYRTSAGTTADYDAKLYFNSNMYGLFSNFQNIYVNTAGTELTNEIYTGPIGYSQASTTVPIGENVERIANTSVYFWKNVQDYESTSTLWSPIESIVFNSTLLPLVFEATGDPVRFGNSNANTPFTDSQSAFQPIITDIALPLQNGSGYREMIYYAPQAEYRLASFVRSKQAINAIDIQVYWKCRLDGQLYPLQMFNSSSVSLKILFRRRGIYSYPHPAQNNVDV